jgi:hypothetical protein
MQVIGEYLEGEMNIAANALSHFSKPLLWFSIIEDESLSLHNVQAYCLPPQLFMMLW